MVKPRLSTQSMDKINSMAVK